MFVEGLEGGDEGCLDVLEGAVVVCVGDSGRGSSFGWFAVIVVRHFGVAGVAVLLLRGFAFCRAATRGLGGRSGWRREEKYGSLGVAGYYGYFVGVVEG